jgi:hypothetical protein
MEDLLQQIKRLPVRFGLNGPILQCTQQYMAEILTFFNEILRRKMKNTAAQQCSFGRARHLRDQIGTRAIPRHGPA